MRALEKYREMYLGKAAVVRGFQQVIDSTNGGLDVKEVCYFVMEESDEYVSELVRVLDWWDGVTWINVTHNSNSAIVQEIGRQLWGEGAHGKIPGGDVPALDAYLEGGELHEMD